MVLSTQRSWQISHIRRVTNFVAHGLTKTAVKQIMDRVWIEEIYEGIRDVEFSSNWLVFHRVLGSCSFIEFLL
jgi:hypothetical protein